LATAVPGLAASALGIEVLRAGERMMHGGPALGIRVPFEHREIHHPQGLPARLDHLQVLAHLDAQRAQRIAHHLGGVGAEEDQVAIGGRRALEDAAHGGIAQELENG
jgi:hypothetical protein